MNTFSRILPALTVYVYSFLLEMLRAGVFPLLKSVSTERKWDLDKRQKLPSPVRDFRGRNVVWLHAASMGEAKLLLKFAGMLSERHKDDLYVVTALTRNGVAFLEKNLHPSFCAVGFLPIDTLPMVERVLNHYGIKRLWLIETELWPSLIMACQRRGIPVGVVNARIEPASFAWYRRIAWLLKGALGQFDPVFAQTQEYADRYVALGVDKSKVHVVGNIKGHIRIERPDRQEWISLRRRMNLDEQAFVVTAGCIHTGEGAVLDDFVNVMNEFGYPCRLIIVPRHLDEVGAILSEIKQQVVHLKECATSRSWEIVIIERVGVLDEMYKIADAAIIGGTFIPIGGHNVWDAACNGIPVFFGRHIDKQKESSTTLLDAGVGFSASGGRALGECMFDVVRKNPMPFFAAQQQFIEQINKRGAILEPLLP